MDEKDRQYHEVANIFPLMSAEEYEALKVDIATNGLLEPVWLHPDDHSIIDGRNRHKACVDLGRDPKFRYWDKQGSLVSFVVSLNLKRRHLTPSQAAMVGVEILPMLEAEAKAKQVKAAVRTNEKRANGNTLVANLPQASEEKEPAPKARDQAAAIVGVSARSIQDAKTVKEHGSTELIAAVKSGQVAVSTAAKIAQAPPREQVVIVAQGPKQIVEASKQIRAEKTEIRRQERKERNEQLCAEPPKLADLPHRFDLVYADPPWRYDFQPTDNRAIENKYPTMELADICNMPVQDITIDNAVLFLWATFPKLEEAFQVVNAWGFKYRTAIVWDKVRMGQGIYTRQQTELLLIAIKGEMYSPEIKYSGNFRSLVSIERSQNHSEKPKEFYGIIEGLYPDCAKVELFARNQREGWTVWGNQA